MGQKKKVNTQVRREDVGTLENHMSELESDFLDALFKVPEAAYQYPGGEIDNDRLEKFITHFMGYVEYIGSLRIRFTPKQLSHFFFSLKVFLVMHKQTISDLLVYTLPLNQLDEKGVEERALGETFLLQSFIDEVFRVVYLFAAKHDIALDLPEVFDRQVAARCDLYLLWLAKDQGKLLDRYDVTMNEDGYLVFTKKAGRGHPVVCDETNPLHGWIAFVHERYFDHETNGFVSLPAFEQSEWGERVVQNTHYPKGLKEYIAHLERQAAERQQAIQTLAHEVTELRHELRLHKIGEVHELQAQVLDLQSTVEHLNSQRQLDQVKIAELERNGSLRQAQSEREMQQLLEGKEIEEPVVHTSVDSGVVAELEHQLKELNERMKQVQRRSDDLSIELEETCKKAETYREQVGDQSRAMNRFVQQKDLLRTVFGRERVDAVLSGQRVEVAHDKQINIINETRDDAETARLRQDLSDALMRAERFEKRADSYLKERTGLMDRVAQAEKENSHLRTQLNSRRERQREEEIELRELRELVQHSDALQAVQQLDGLRRSVEQLQGNARTLKFQNRTMRGQVQRLESANKDLEREVRHLIASQPDSTQSQAVPVHSASVAPNLAEPGTTAYEAQEALVYSFLDRLSAIGEELLSQAASELDGYAEHIARLREYDEFYYGVLYPDIERSISQLRAPLKSRDTTSRGLLNRALEAVDSRLQESLAEHEPFFQEESALRRYVDSLEVFLDAIDEVKEGIPERDRSVVAMRRPDHFEQLNLNDLIDIANEVIGQSHVLSLIAKRSA